MKRFARIIGDIDFAWGAFGVDLIRYISSSSA